MISLQNNKLILNGHRISDMKQLFEFFERKFKCEVISKDDIEKILKNYTGLNIAVWHADTFLRNETEEIHDVIIKLLEKYGTVKQTGKKKNN